jgi:hypothetical protein
VLFDFVLDGVAIARIVAERSRRCMSSYARMPFLIYWHVCSEYSQRLFKSISPPL